MNDFLIGGAVALLGALVGFLFNLWMQKINDNKNLKRETERYLIEFENANFRNHTHDSTIMYEGFPKILSSIIDEVQRINIYVILFSIRNIPFNQNIQEAYNKIRTDVYTLEHNYSQEGLDEEKAEQLTIIEGELNGLCDSIRKGVTNYLNKSKV